MTTTKTMSTKWPSTRSALVAKSTCWTLTSTSLTRGAAVAEEEGLAVEDVVAEVPEANEVVALEANAVAVLVPLRPSKGTRRGQALHEEVAEAAPPSSRRVAVTSGSTSRHLR
jgi:hypothetical protein